MKLGIYPSLCRVNCCVLQERRIRRLGSNKEINVEVRVVVAGNERLEYLVESGHFRMDLYQRLNEFCIEIPPLRQRKDDIVFLCKRFMDITNKELNKNIRGITKEALEILLTYNWPGNVRELKNVIRRAVLLAVDIVEPKHLLIKTQEQKQESGPAAVQMASAAGQKADQAIPLDLDMNNGNSLSLRDMVAKCVENVEKKLISEGTETDWRKQKARLPKYSRSITRPCITRSRITELKYRPQPKLLRSHQLRTRETTF